MEVEIRESIRTVVSSDFSHSEISSARQSSARWSRHHIQRLYNVRLPINIPQFGVAELMCIGKIVMPAHFPTFLAEVSDKMNSWPALIAWVAGISAASVVALRKRSWLAAIPGLLALLWAWGACDIVADRFMRPAVITELGMSYILIEYVPLAVFLVLLLIRTKKSPNQRPDGTAAKAPPSNPSQAAAVPNP
ncbi:MAG: hypothetical protein IPL39_12370 [Opitutaceae bacterium]|nr:hypothetical protein [Opitutaceae bacterium]